MTTTFSVKTEKGNQGPSDPREGQVEKVKKKICETIPTQYNVTLPVADLTRDIFG